MEWTKNDSIVVKGFEIKVMQEIKKYSTEEFVNFSTGELNEISDVQLLILKGHILVEYCLNCYLESVSTSENSDFFKKDKMNFSTKLKVLKHFTTFGSDADIIEELIMLNSIRNEIAHSLSYNENLLKKLFAEIKKKSPSGIFLNPNSNIKAKIIGSIAFINGALFGAYKYNTDKKDIESYLNKNNLKRADQSK